MFQDFLVLDLYNKLSRFIAIWIFYVGLGVFLIGMNVNDSWIAAKESFFNYMPVILLIVGLVIVSNYETEPNLFYPKIGI